MLAHDETRIRFEAAVVERLKESGFLEIQIRTECLARVDDGYQDEVINAGWHYWQAGMADGRNQQSVEMYKVIKPQTTGKTDALLHLFADPALIGIPEEMIESGGHWRACTGCYDTEDGHPTQKYLYSPTLQTEIGCGCTECGGIGAVWWYMSDEDVAEFAKCCEEIDKEIVLEARIERLERALHKISSPTQTEDLLWWQIEARQALGKEEATIIHQHDDALREAAANVIAVASDTYKKRNGHVGSFEDESGEKCWIVPFDAFEALRSAVDIENCPVCDQPLEPDDICATDIELGICHAECLKDSPVVDLDTGEKTGGEITTFRYGDRDNA